jgi:uncharacterized delta-60 repeat protein
MSVARGWWMVAWLAACGLSTACGDDDQAAPTDGGVDASSRIDGGDAGSLDAGADAAFVPVVYPHDAGGYVDDVIFTALSAAGHDRFFGVTYDALGNLYAVGQSAPSTAPGADFSFVLAKYSPSGVLDTRFGSNGVAMHNVTVGGLAVEAARAVVVQADGKIVVAGDAEHAASPNPASAGPAASDADVCLLRFTASGQLDPSFGTNGLVRLNLADGVVVTPAANDNNPTPQPVLLASDETWSLLQTADGKLVVHAGTRGLGPSLADGGVRTDSDFAMIRLSADGALDPSFGNAGVVRTDFDNTDANGVRGATLLADGSLIGTGYVNSTLLTGNASSVVNPVWYKLLPNGSADATFASDDQVPAPGVWYDFARPDMKSVEAYGAAPQGDRYVTVGYGPTPNRFSNGTADLIWLRFNADGSRDTTFGTDGLTYQDVAGYDDNARSLASLPNGKVIATGRAIPKQPTVPYDLSAVPADALISVIDERGLPLEAFGPGGVRLYDFGGPQDHLWQVALAPDQKSVATVGVKSAKDSSGDDDAALVIVRLP